MLLDGETILHTKDAKAAMREEGLAIVPRWPAHSPDLNPQENVWAWAETHLRKKEKKNDLLSTFKRRVAESCKKHPSKEVLVSSMSARIAECARRRGANIGK
jgi:transposase